MPDWTQLAHARSLDIPTEQLERIAPPLNGLETAFRPLPAALPFAAYPADAFAVEPFEEEGIA
jgi:hypothetical protein